MSLWRALRVSRPAATHRSTVHDHVSPTADSVQATALAAQCRSWWGNVAGSAAVICHANRLAPLVAPSRPKPRFKPCKGGCPAGRHRCRVVLPDGKKAERELMFATASPTPLRIFGALQSPLPRHTVSSVLSVVIFIIMLLLL